MSADYNFSCQFMSFVQTEWIDTSKKILGELVTRLRTAMESAFGRWAAGDKRPNTAVSLNRSLNDNKSNSSLSLFLCAAAEKDWNQAEKQCNATFDTLCYCRSKQWSLREEKNKKKRE